MSLLLPSLQWSVTWCSSMSRHFLNAPASHLLFLISHPPCRLIVYVFNNQYSVFISELPSSEVGTVNLRFVSMSLYSWVSLLFTTPSVLITMTCSTHTQCRKPQVPDEDAIRSACATLAQARKHKQIGPSLWYVYWALTNYFQRNVLPGRKRRPWLTQNVKKL